MRWNLTTSEVESIRLPVLSDAPGFGRFPQMVLAFGGENAAMVVENGTIMTSQRMGLLALENGSSEVGLTGLLPYAYGNDSMVMLTSSGLYTALPGFEQLRDLDGVVLGLVSLTDAERLALAGEDDRSLLMFSGEGFSSDENAAILNITDWLNQQSGVDDLHLSVLTVQLDAAEQAAESSGVLSAMFLVFGTFTIAAGVLLSLTIIMLLADVRQQELASLRALGLRKSDARALFVQGGRCPRLPCRWTWVGCRPRARMGDRCWFPIHLLLRRAQTFAFAWSMDSFLAGWMRGPCFPCCCWHRVPLTMPNSTSFEPCEVPVWCSNPACRGVCF